MSDNILLSYRGITGYIAAGGNPGQVRVCLHLPIWVDPAIEKTTSTSVLIDNAVVHCKERKITAEFEKLVDNYLHSTRHQRIQISSDDISKKRLETIHTIITNITWRSREQKLTFEVLTEMIGCHKDMLWNIEKGRYVPSFDLLVELAVCLKCSVGDLTAPVITSGTSDGSR